MVVRSNGLPPSNLTTCPRTVQEVESVRAGGRYPPLKPPFAHNRDTTLKYRYNMFCKNLK